MDEGTKNRTQRQNVKIQDYPGRILPVVLVYASFASLWILLSDRLVEWLFTNSAHLSLANTFKGLAFVAVTSLLLYGLISRLCIKSTGTGSSISGSLRSMALPLSMLAIAVAVATGAGMVHTLTEQREQEMVKLKTISDLKTHEIEEWLDERLSDAQLVQSNRNWSELYRRWRDDDDAESRDLFQERIKTYLSYNFFQGALVLDDRFDFFWTADARLLHLDPVLRRGAERAVLESRVILIGPYRDAGDHLHLDFVAHLPDVYGKPGPTLILHIDPTHNLYPSLEAWPMPSDTGESLLFSKEGDQAVILNEARHRHDTALKQRIPLTHEDSVEAKSLRKEGIEHQVVKGLDYRGVPVVAFVNAVRGTDWFLSTKIDQAELSRNTNRDLLWMALSGFLSLLMAGTGLLVFRQRQWIEGQIREQLIQGEKLNVMRLLEAISEGSVDAIFAKDIEGRYLLFNREAARLTGKTQQEVLGQDDTSLFPSEQARSIIDNDRQVMADDRSVTFKEDLTTVDGQISFLATKGPLHDESGKVIGMFGISRDITLIQRAEKERQMTVDFLGLVNESRDEEELIRSAVLFFQERSGHEAVGIRLKKGDDYPYYESRGFPVAFVKAENSLCSKDDMGNVVRDEKGYPLLACMCGNIIRGRFDPTKPFFSENGSFWTNNTTNLLATTSEADRKARTRNRCNGEGYESVALIPLRVGEDRLGLLQLNDRREGQFSAEIISLWERLAGYLAVAVSKFQAEGFRRKTEELFRAIIDNAQSVIWFKDLEGRFLILNRCAERTLGRSADQLIGRTNRELMPEAIANEFSNNDSQVIASGCPVILEESARLENSLTTFLSVKFPVRNQKGEIYGLAAICTDISERKQAEIALRNSLEEKVALLKEVHHRVKNNLQIVASLLSLQSNRSHNTEVLDVLKDTRHRVKSMALLHEALYRSGSMASINFGTYVKDLCGQLLIAYGSTGSRVQIQYRLTGVVLPLEEAVPCGLIINELVSNALKHGFPDGRKGNVMVGVEPLDADYLELNVVDDGIGLAVGAHPSNRSTLGLQLVDRLANQLGGRFEKCDVGGPGARFRVIFPIHTVAVMEDP